MNSPAILNRAEQDSTRLAGYVDRIAAFRFRLQGQRPEGKEVAGASAATPAFDSETFIGRMANCQEYVMRELDRLGEELNALERFFPEDKDRGSMVMSATKAAY